MLSILQTTRALICTLSSNSSVGSSGLHAFAYAEFDKTDVSGSSNLYSTSADASAIAKWNDFVVTGPAGVTTVAISVNLFIEGTFSLIGDDTPERSFFFHPLPQRGNMSVGIYASNQNVGSGQAWTSIQNGITDSGSNGILTGFNGSKVISSQTFNVPVNTPFSLELSLSANAGAVGRENQTFYLESTTNFNNTLTFAADRPVFNLPGGYTINSVEAGILNNAVAVPEPRTLALIFVGFAAAVLRQAQRETYVRCLAVKKDAEPERNQLNTFLSREIARILLVPARKTAFLIRPNTLQCRKRTRK